jgi:hypothetical protein
LEIPSKTKNGTNTGTNDESKYSHNKGMNTIVGYLDGSYKPSKYQKVKIQTDVNKDIGSDGMSRIHK